MGAPARTLEGVGAPQSLERFLVEHSVLKGQANLQFRGR